MRKFAYFGTPQVAEETLARLLENGFAPSVVITNPDAPKGRGMELASSPVKALALKKNISVLTPEKLDEIAIAEIKTYGCDYAIVVAYGKLFPQALIDIFPMSAINVHYSLLPKYRGASPVEAALLHGEEMTGVSVQKLALKMDAGDVLAQKEITIAPEETARELFPRLITLGADLLLQILPEFEKGELVATPQEEVAASYAPKIKKEDGLLDLSAAPEANWNKYRAFIFRPTTYFIEDDVRMKITKASFSNGVFKIERVIPENGKEVDYSPRVRK